jgi:hypothetical protein
MKTVFPELMVTVSSSPEPLGWAVVISLLSVVVSALALIFARYSWQQSNRPVVSARIETAAGGNVGIALNIVVENSGNRPATDVFLKSDMTLVARCLSAPGQVPTDAKRCLSSEVCIPILLPEKPVTNSFGFLGNAPGAWKSGSIIPLTIRYRDLAGNGYKSKLNLLLADTAGFAQTFWESSTLSPP